MLTSELSPRSRLVTLLFCFLLGVFGAHRFYVGKMGTAVLMLLTFGGLGIWAIVDFILIAAGSFRDAEGRRVFLWFEPESLGHRDPITPASTPTQRELSPATIGADRDR